MFKRVKTEGFIINGTEGSVYLTDFEWSNLSSSEILKELIGEGIASCEDLADPYALYDKFLHLDDHICGLEDYLSVTLRMPSSLKEKLLDGFRSYLLSTKLS